MTDRDKLKTFIDISSDVYETTQIIEITSTEPEASIFYSTDGSYPTKQYFGAIGISKTSVIRSYSQIGEKKSEEISVEIEIRKEKKSNRGTVVIIGGSEHCQEIHQKIIEYAGGPEKAKIAFIPTSSANPYAGGMERLVRFKELGGLKIDENLVPEINGKKDYSSLDNKSNFWIVPIALLDDDTTGAHIQDDMTHPLVNESGFPDIDESKWSENGHLKSVAEKLRDGGYNIIFLTGGNQARYLQCLLYDDSTETPVLTIIREILEEEGGVIAGTSAGAAILSNVMIQGGGSYGATMHGVIYKDIDLINYDDNYTPFRNEHDGRVWLGKGLGFLPENIITGTHFIVRGRAGRLLTAALYLRSAKKFPIIGIGVGEDTAVFVSHDNTCEIVGSGGVLILDTSKSKIQEGNPETGKLDVNNVIMHYLEQGDHFSISGKTSEIVINKINDEKIKIIEPEYTNGKQYYIEHDIFGSRVFKKFIFNCLIKNSADHCIGLEIIDNTEESYDSILFHDIVKDDTIMITFRKTNQTKGFSGNIKYHWWGGKDMDYPNLKQETEKNRFSFTDVLMDATTINLLNFPDMDDGRNIPLKKHYLKRGYSEEDWYDIFDSEKKFHYGLIVIMNETGLNIRTFFFDYAFHDVDKNGKYSPPRYASTLKDREFQDYDIVEINTAPCSKIFINEKLAGITDDFGLLILPESSRPEKIKAVFSGKRTDYSVEMNIKDMEGKKFMIFSKVSW